MGQLSLQSRGARPMCCSRRGNRFTSSITCPGRSITGTMWKAKSGSPRIRRRQHRRRGPHKIYMDESERTDHGVFANADEAVAACKEIVDDELNTIWKPGTTAKELYKLYIEFGPDPFVVPLNPRHS